MPEWWVVFGSNKPGIYRMCTSPATQNLLHNAGQDGFYAVVVRNPAGIHHTKQGAIQAGSSFAWPKWKCTHTLCDALVYMVVKGIEAQLPPVVTQVHAATSRPTRPQNTDIDELDCLFEGALHIELPGPSARDCALPSHHGPSFTQQTNPAQSSCQLPSHASPIIYTHVWSLRGITESQHHHSADTAACTQALVLGPHAAWYLTAHGYTCEAVDTIIDTHNSSSSDHQFVLRLSQHGLAMAEVSYIWHLIQL
ncbi:hypothetical protein EDC04DRAFT_2600621 [Pisolithus marmoratus]|nr:hypothetical protein EDC04DRAFT_2600621 [Pisolithus marmoratus]